MTVRGMLKNEIKSPLGNLICVKNIFNVIYVILNSISKLTGIVLQSLMENCC